MNLEARKIDWVNDDNKKEAFVTPAVSKTHVVFGSDDGRVYAVAPRTGKTLWKTDAGGTPTSPVIAGGKVVVAADGTLFLLDLATGGKLWSKEISDDITSPSLIAGQIVVGTDDGRVIAYGSK
jgi:outer membrane protein assembly factor BamB